MLSGFSLGTSLIVRPVWAAVFTHQRLTGADLLGKVEAGIPRMTLETRL